jgi:nucleoside-diphosphate-sugar epimerase
MRALVTGGLGFIGSHVVDALVADGHEVHVIDTAEPTREKNTHAIYHVLDIRSRELVTPLMQGVEAVFHLAALPRVQYSIENPIETFDMNVNGTVALLKAASDTSVRRFVFSSSAAVYGDQATMPLSENIPAAPKSPYALHKAIGEMTCKLWSELYGLETVCLRYFNVYGPRLDPNGAYALAIGKFLRLRAEGAPIEIWGDGTNTRDYVHVSDVVRANILAAMSPKVGKGEVVNIGTGRETNVNILASLIGGDTTHVEARVEPGRAQADVKRAHELLGWEATITLEDGIAALKKEWGLM